MNVSAVRAVSGPPPVQRSQGRDADGDHDGTRVQAASPAGPAASPSAAAAAAASAASAAATSRVAATSGHGTDGATVDVYA